MIDFHAHILPGIDDGSQSVEESLAMLDALTAQGITTVVATPHFCADECTVADFLSRRNRAAETLANARSSDTPQILLGAEVLYYAGISRMEGLEQLRIGQSKLLLLEMPMTKWTEYTVRELVELASAPQIRLALAHVERYLTLQSADVWKRLLESGIRFQCNASFFRGFSAKHKALQMARQGKIHFLGSDCHNMTSRPPRIDEAYALLEKKLGAEYVTRLCESVKYLLAQKQ